MWQCLAHTFRCARVWPLGSMPPYVHGQRPPPALRFRVTGATARPSPPRPPAPPTRRAKYRHLDLHDPSGRSYETQLASLFQERQAFRLHLQLNLESIIRLVCTRIILCYSTIRITACCTHVQHHLLKNSFSSHCVFVLTPHFTTVFIELFVNKSREPF